MRKVRFALLGLAAVLVMAMAPAAQVALAATPTDVFFSEYVEGSSLNKALEIYNGTGASIDLAAGSYVIEISFNGGTSTTSIALTGVVADGDVYVVADDGADPAILAEADQTPTNNFFNGDDAIILWSGGIGGTVVDSFGQLGVDPGSEWSGGGIGAADETLRRQAAICAGDTNTGDAFDPSVEWEGFAQDTFDGLGSHTADCTPDEPEVPDLAISEIMYDPNSAEDNWEWIEVYNGGSSSVDLTGYVVDDFNSVALSAANIAGGSIPAGGTAILYNVDDVSAADFEAAWGTGINLVAVTNWSALSLNNTGDMVSLWVSFTDYSGDNVTHANALDTVAYNGAGFPDPVGASIYLTDLSADNNVGTNWATSTDGGATPLGTGYTSAAAGGNSGADVGSPGGTLVPPGDAAPEVSSTTPASSTTGVAVDANINITFSEDVTLGAWYDLICSSSGAHTATVSGGPAAYTLDPDADFALNETCTVTVYAAEVADNDTDDPPDNMAADYVFGFDTFVAATDDAPSVSSTSPANGATGVAFAANIGITFSEDVTLSGAWYDLTCTASGTHTATVSGGPAAYTLDPDTDFVGSETCTVTVYAAQVTDNDTDDPPDNMAADYVFSFNTQLGISYIHDIQGAGANVTGPGPFRVEGVVVGDLQENSPPEFDGFFLQEEDADADSDDATSEGIFVYCGGTCPTDVSVGDLVQVTGGASDFNGLSELTATGASDVVVVSSGNPLPTAATLSFPVAPAVGGVDYLERYEGMRISMPGPMTITEYFNLDRYGEFLVAAGGRVYQYTQVNPPDAAGYQAFLEDFALRTITIDDGYNYQNPDPLIYPPLEFSATNSFRGGDTVTDVVGVLHYAFGLWRIQPADPPTVAGTFNPENPRPASAPAVGGDLKVASFNVLNYFNGDGQGGGFPTSRGAFNLFEFERQRAKILAAMSQMDVDIIGLMELENDYGDGPDSAVADLVNGLNAAGTTCSNWAYVDPGVPQLGTDEIAVGFIYCTDTVEIAAGTSPAYLNTPDVFDGINTSRTPLAVTFAQKSTGAAVTVVVNHLKSKGDSGLADDPVCQSTPEANPDCDQGDGQGYWNYRRTQGAELLLAWLAVKPTGTMDSDVLLIGDMNAYALEDPVQTFLDAGYENMVTTFQGTDAYSYVFSGQWGSLDHVLANSTLAAQVVGAEDWHINSDEPDALDYNTDFRNADQVANWYLPNAFRSSDHDPVLIGLELNAAPVCGSAYPSHDTLWPPDGRFDRITIRGVTDPDGDPISINIDSIFQDEPVFEWHGPWSARRDRRWWNYGWYTGTAPDGKGVGTSTAWLRAERDMPGNGRVYHVYFTATDGNGGACSGEVTVGVPKHRGFYGWAVDDGPLYDSTVTWPWW